LPYTLTFEVETARRVRPVRIEGRAEGQWQGVGVWWLQPYGDGHGGQSLVVRAIREGRQCGQAVDALLMGGSDLAA